MYEVWICSVSLSFTPAYPYGKWGGDIFWMELDLIRTSRKRGLVLRNPDVDKKDESNSYTRKAAVRP
jgi:hypothetical protein